MNFGKQNLAEGKISRCVIVLAGIVLFQSFLYGPSLTGQKVILPLDILSMPGWYLPQTPGAAPYIPQDLAEADLVDQYEPTRVFSVTEIQQGRFPWWGPFQYGGSPCIWPKFSPFLLLEYTTRSPVILAWAQLASALVAGVGMYVFGRRLLRIGFWPAAISAWLYPLTAFFTLWYGSCVPFPVCWLPWLFVAVDAAVRHPGARSVAGLGFVTGLVLVSGDLDVAGQALLGAGLYALWCLYDAYHGVAFVRKLPRPLACLIVGWGLGFMLATPYLLPLLEYARTGARIAQRSQGLEERPPTGLAALPQVVLPDMYATTPTANLFAKDSESNLIESTSAAYAGVLATLLIAPLAWLNRTRQRLNWFWIGLAFFGLSWCLDVPGLVDLLRLPGLNMMSHNRLVFLTTFALCALAVTGLENIISGQIEWRRWFWWPAASLGGLCAWSLYRSFAPPKLTEIPNLDLGWFHSHYVAAAVFCGLGFAAWTWLWSKKSPAGNLFIMLAVLWTGDLLWFAHGRMVQCDPKLYYPAIPALSETAKAVPGRVIGLNCLPASLSVMAGLNDIRGHDAVDPVRMVDLINLGAVPNGGVVSAAIQNIAPKREFIPPDGVRLMPVLDMLNVRYLVVRGTPPPQFKPKFQSDDYSVMINTNALPRTFVPRSVETVPDDAGQLNKLGAPDFDPAAVAYVPAAVSLPSLCRGTATITNEIPTRIMVSVHMDTPGLVMLADRWDKGWHALWNGQPVEILQANHAIRGVILPAGAGTLEFYYRPASLVLGCYLAASAVLILLVLVILPERFGPQ